MDESVNGSPRRVGRILLLAAGVGLLWAGISVLTSPSTAHADDDERGGLTALVGGVTGAASDLVGATTDAVGDVLPPVAPVTDAVAETVSTATTTVSDTVASVPEVVPELQPVIEPVVTEIVQPVAVEVVQPIVDGVGSLVEPIPVVSDVVGAIDLPGIVGAVPGVVGAVDDTVKAVVGGPLSAVGSVDLPSPGSGVVPGWGDDLAPALPAAWHGATAAPAVSAGFSAHDAEARSAAPWLFGAPPLPGHSAPWESSAPTGSSTSGSWSGSAASALGWVESSACMGAVGSAVAPRDGDDDLPSSPVFDTDVAPD